MNLKGIKLTWLGHATFRLQIPEGKIVLIDPWVMGNPMCPDKEKDVKQVDIMLCTHGHGDHIGDAVEIAGVNVGKVLSLSLNQERARVAMRIDRGVTIDEDAIAAIRTRGIIGDRYVAISPGPSEKFLADGAVLRQTESAFVLEDVIGQLINNAGTGGGKKQSAEKGSNGNDLPTLTDPGSGKSPPPSAK